MKGILIRVWAQREWQQKLPHLKVYFVSVDLNTKPHDNVKFMKFNIEMTGYGSLKLNVKCQEKLS
jgi:hypothetical protein